VRSGRLALRQLLLDSFSRSAIPLRAPEQGAVDIEAVDTLERAEHRRQEQLCVPLVPAYTYWYLQACPDLLGLAADRLDRWEQQR
jgi:hypothetical protein